MSPAIKAVVFDFDGLILDTETAEFEAWAYVYRHHGLEPLSVEDWSHAIGTRDAVDPVRILLDRLGTDDLDREAIKGVGRPVHDELLAAEAVLPGVEDWIASASALGLRVGVASSSSLDWVEGHLQRLGLVDRFACLSCYEEPLRAKPAPDLYLAACESLGVAPDEAMAVEDSPNGVAAAKAAGMFCVAVPRGMTAALDFSAADVVTPSLAELPLGDALSRHGGADA